LGQGMQWAMQPWHQKGMVFLEQIENGKLETLERRRIGLE